ncbi:MAG: glutamine--fructose-6-phosphate transaminase (isomerizing) [Marinilabiliaceae bacterium]|nr:glutamine--fructose-6-phosphate transaminase (isomerizing) [Marinilabiliaceae bacterium]
MCGIVGYIGTRTAYPILIKGLQRLEYRGYDSAGIALMDNGNASLYKCKGKVRDLENLISGQNIAGTIGIGHTRWATHGLPNDINAHPHKSMNGKFILVHNGIIENYASIKKMLAKNGYKFQSETDTEVLVNLIENIYLEEKVSAETAVQTALRMVVGAYGIVVICLDEPDKLIASRKSSPLVIGCGEGEYFLASDATPITEYTDRVLYLNDEEIAVVSTNGISLKNLNNEAKELVISRLNLSIESFDKGNFPHYMLKEIHEQSTTIADSFRGRINNDMTQIMLGGINEVIPRIAKAKRIVIVACGTSYHAGLVGEYLFETFARQQVEVEYASEFRYRDPIIEEDDVVIAISQSGETADTLAAIRMAKEKGALILGICNVVGSSIARETHAGVYTHAGPEIGVASTKAFTAQVIILTMMAYLIGKRRGFISDETYHSLIEQVLEIPDKIKEILKDEDHIKEISQKYVEATNAIYLGRGFLYPVALEGALKLKEISYIHAEGYPAAEMKHGPIALIDDKMPVFVLGTKDKYYEKIVSNIQEVKARKGKVIAVVTQGDTTIKHLADDVIEIPEIDESLSPILSVIPLQLISYYIAVMRGCNVDQPRNLAKSVTVE